ncbi:MAG: FG-GAP repeat protein [Flavobacteriales bacterium]|nr:FG-GAP repeat protein [Flavobacteriales bacterium]
MFRQDFPIQHKYGPLDVILDHSDLHPLILNGTDAHLLDRTGHFVFSYTGLRAWDACGSPLQARMIADTVNGRLLLRVDDRVAEYPIMIDPVATTHDVLLLGTASGGRFGRSVNTAGDLNGDGYSDVVIGAREASNGQASEGLVHVHYGSSTGIGIVPDLVLEIDQASASFGNSVSTAGDINGDGFSDLIVGAPNWESDAATLGSEGAIFIYYGSAVGKPGTVPNVTRRANSAAKYMGWSVAGAGDINNDGYSDIITGGWLATYGPSNEGAAWCLQEGPLALQLPLCTAW